MWIFYHHTIWSLRSNNKIFVNQSSIVSMQENRNSGDKCWAIFTIWNFEIERDCICLSNSLLFSGKIMVWKGRRWKLTTPPVSVKIISKPAPPTTLTQRQRWGLFPPFFKVLTERLRWVVVVARLATLISKI